MSMMGSRGSYQTVDLPEGKDGREEMVIWNRGEQSGEGGNDKNGISCHGLYVVSSIQKDISEGKVSLSILFRKGRERKSIML